MILFIVGMTNTIDVALSQSVDMESGTTTVMDVLNANTVMEFGQALKQCNFDDGLS